MKNTLKMIGAGLFVYLVVWVLFIGGIVQVVDALKVTPVESLDLALGIVRFLFTWVAIAVGAFVAIFMPS